MFRWRPIRDLAAARVHRTIPCRHNSAHSNISSGVLPLDFLTVSIAMSIGTAVAWLVALYTTRGSYLLFWNTFFGMAGAFLCLWTAAEMTPALRLIVLVIAGPVCAALA